MRMLTPRELHDAMGLPPELASDYGKAAIKVPLWPPVTDRHRPVTKDVMVIVTVTSILGFLSLLIATVFYLMGRRR